MGGISRTRARVINVQVSDEADAFLIFETLNARGRELTVADLLKNYLFRLAHPTSGRCRVYGVQPYDRLRRARTKKFLPLLFFTSRRLSMGQHESGNCTHESGYHFQASGPFFRCPTQGGRLLSTRRCLASISRTGQRTPSCELLHPSPFGAEQNRPLLLATIRRLAAEKEIQKLVRAIVSWSVRGIIVGGFGAAQLNVRPSAQRLHVTRGKRKLRRCV